MLGLLLMFCLIWILVAGLLFVLCRLCCLWIWLGLLCLGLVCFCVSDLLGFVVEL